MTALPPLDEFSYRALPYNESHSYNLMLIGSYWEIILNPDLFWSAFCLAARLKQIDLVVVDNDQLNALKATIKRIRKVFETYFPENTPLTLIILSNVDEYYVDYKQEVVETTSWPGLNPMKKRVYQNIFTPAFQKLHALFGLLLEKGFESQKILDRKFKNSHSSRQVECWKLYWVANQFYVPFCKIEKRSSFWCLNARRKKKMLCDFKLIADGGELWAHKVVLFEYGESFFKGIFLMHFLEDKINEINFNGYSVETVSACLDFIYLGPQGLPPEKILALNINLYELFSFAHAYQISELEKWTINCIIHLAKPHDLPDIEALHQLYSIDILKRLALHLRKLQKA